MPTDYSHTSAQSGTDSDSAYVLLRCDGHVLSRALKPSSPTSCHTKASQCI